MSWWTADRQAYALNYLMSAGLTPHGAAALVSRWKNVEAPAGPASRGGYRGRAWGIAQWLGPRLPPIDGNPNFDDQLAYVVQELNSTEARAGAILRSATDEWSAAVGASVYERAEGYNPATGVDNFTSRTANGVGAILALVGNISSSPVNYADAYSSYPGLQTPDSRLQTSDDGAGQFFESPGGIGIGAVVAGVVGLLVLVMLIRD